MPEIITGGMIREDPVAMLDRINMVKEAGGDYYVLGLGRYENADTFKRSIDKFAAEVMPKI